MLMAKRNNARKNGNLDEYKRLRNECNRKIRIEKQIEAGKMIQEDPNKIWNIYNKTVNGRRKAKIMLKEDGLVIEDDKHVANLFNTYFKEKTEMIKKSI